MPIAHTDSAEPGGIVPTTTNALTTADDPRHRAEADTTPVAFDS